MMKNMQEITHCLHEWTAPSVMIDIKQHLAEDLAAERLKVCQDANLVFGRHRFLIALPFPALAIHDLSGSQVTLQ